MDELATGFAYQWRRCDTAGANCANIAAATGSSYLLVAGDVGSTIRVEVTASNGAGSTAATSAATATVTAAPAPVNTAPPVDHRHGPAGPDADSASTGTWTNSPTGFAYQWRRCDTAGANCANIAAATGSSYLLVAAADVGSTIRVEVTASNGAGSNAATSAATATVTAAPAAPVNTAPPAITGTAQEGQTLSASTGTWTNSPTGFAYQWRRCDTAGANCANIAGANASSYLLVAGDVGSTIRVEVTASNGAGGNSATSAATATVTAAPAAPVNTAPPTITGTAQQGQTLSASTGTWSNSPTGFAYQWRRCDTAGANCAEHRRRHRLELPARRWRRRFDDPRPGDGVERCRRRTPRQSAATATVTAAPAAPVNTAPPTITGTAQQGQTLSASTGTWTNSPTGFAYQWRRCDTAGANCANIASATGSSYLLVAGDVGSTIRVQVTASNGAGSNAATSAATTVVQAAGPPVNLVLNPGFETNPSEWPTLGNGATSWATDSVHSGSRSVKIVTTNESLTRWTQLFNVSPGQHYDASAWIRATSGRGSLAITFWNGTTYTGLTLETALVTGDWQRVTLSATVPSGANRIRLELRSAYTRGTRWFDDAELFNTTGGPPPTNPPVNTAPPTITGTAQQGQTLSASTGTWTNSPTGFAYQWRRCDTAGANCANIASATGSSYLLVAGDVGSTIRVQVTASNSAGGNSAQSAASAVVSAAASAPVNTAPPAITGTPQQGQTLSASTGTWTNSPTNFAYQWRRCDTAGKNCSNISGATGSSYLLVAGDVGSTIRVQVTASNGAGGNSAQSAATATVTAAPSAPVNTAPPTITGTAQQGQTLSASTGTWTNSPTGFAYQWRRCDTAGANCQNIAGATGSSYLLVAGDVGSTIRVQVTASNGAGSNAATSAATATVAAAPSAPTNTAPPTITGTAEQGQTLSASTGTWTNSPTGFAYQWLRCNTSGASCQNISGATGSSYLLVAGDVGSTIRVQVTASNGAGGNAAQSAATGVVQAQPPGNPTNLCLNPGFETNPTEWAFLGTGGTGTWATDSVHSGSSSVKIVSTNDALHRWTQNFAVTPGQRYQLSTWIRTTSGRGSLAATFWNGATYNGLTLETASVTGDWQKVTLTLTVPSGVDRMRLELRNAYTVGTRWFDDVEVFQV